MRHCLVKQCLSVGAEKATEYPLRKHDWFLFSMILLKDEVMTRFMFGLLTLSILTNEILAEDLSKLPFAISNVVPPLDDGDDPRASFRREPGSLPIKVAPFIEHRRGSLPQAATQQPLAAVAVDGPFVQVKNMKGEIYQLDEDEQWTSVEPDSAFASLKQMELPNSTLREIRKTVRVGNTLWFATSHGLYRQPGSDKKVFRHEAYGTNGPLATDIRDIRNRPQWNTLVSNTTRFECS